MMSSDWGVMMTRSLIAFQKAQSIEEKSITEINGDEMCSDFLQGSIFLK